MRHQAPVLFTLVALMPQLTTESRYWVPRLRSFLQAAQRRRCRLISKARLPVRLRRSTRGACPRREGQQIADSHERMRKIASVNRTIIAKSGVRVEGSPNSVLAANEQKALRQQRRIRRRADIERTQYRNQARSAQYAGGMGIASSLISTTGRSLLARDNPLAASLLGTA